MNGLSRLLCPVLICLCFLGSPILADTPPDQAEGYQKLRGIASNIQKNRDGTIRFIRFSKPIVTDEHLARITVFKQLDYLAVVTPNVTDAGLSHVAELTNLDTLFLSKSGLTDAGMTAFQKLEKLERLYVDHTAVTDAGLKTIAGLSALKILSLDGTNVTDVGLKTIAGFENLETLSLRNSTITDAGCESLAALSKLKVLQLDGTNVSDTGLKTLSGLKTLEELSLGKTLITTQGLAALKQIPRLKVVRVSKTKITKSDLPTLKQILPKTVVVIDPAAGETRNPWQRFLAGEKLRTSKTNQNSPEKPSEETVASTASFAQPDFQRHVVPLLGRLGCNGRSCHGSFQGQGGFQLSMFGYDFKADYDALAGGESPRVDVENPDESLILTHPTTEDHGGGIRFEKGGWEYQLLRNWVRGGAKVPGKQPQKLAALEVTPAEIVFANADETTQLKAVAVWEDGSREDVTRLTRFQTNDDVIAEVSKTGKITSGEPGDTWVISFYDSAVFQTQVLQPFGNGTATEPKTAATPTKIDEFIARKLNQLNIQPSEICTDEEFLRRVSLDLAGTLPTAREVEEFVADSQPDKRARKIDELLETPAYAQWWAMWLSDLTGANAQHLGTTDMNRPSADQWNAWLLRRVQDNVGWDEITAGILLAESRRPGQSYESYAAEQSRFLSRQAPEDFTAHENPMHYYWFRSNIGQPADRALSFGYIFLGVRLQCAQCHKHPFDQWSKEDFDLFSNFFKRIQRGIAPDARVAQTDLKTKLGVPKKLDTAALRRQMYLRVSAEGLPIPWNEIWIEPPGDKPLPARLLGQNDLNLSEWDDPREPLVAWLLDEQNPYFAPSFVNRIWARHFGVGIVDPPDDFNLANPPSNKALLDWLSREFIRSGYDMKWLHRTITNSAAYQRSWRPNASNVKDTKNFSRALIRRLPAEVTVDAILQATNNDQRAATWDTDLKGRKIGFHPVSIQARSLDYSLLVFGKPLRTTNCDCEREMKPTLLQSLYVRNDQEVKTWLERGDGWVTQMTKTNPPLSETELISRAYLRTVGRTPSEAELATARKHFAVVETPQEALHDLMWVLLNTREFLTNH